MSSVEHEWREELAKRDARIVELTEMYRLVVARSVRHADRVAALEAGLRSLLDVSKHAHVGIDPACLTCAAEDWAERLIAQKNMASDDEIDRRFRAGDDRANGRLT